MRIPRRTFLSGGGGLVAASAMSGIAPAGADPLTQIEHPGWTRYAVGDLEITVVSDGSLGLGDPGNWFTGLDEAQMAEVFRSNFLNPSQVTLPMNVLVMRSSNRLALIDAGSGGRASLGPDGGRLMQNLASAGFNPGDVTDLLFTHGHPDHIFGLSDASGRLNFPNAQVHITETDFDFFTDEENVKEPKNGAFIEATRRELLAVEDRLSMIVDGGEVIPGVSAMAAPGHTMGHVVFMIDSGGDRLLAGGDLAHHMALFTRHPEAGFVSDLDPEMMVKTRTRFFDMIAADRLKFLCYHFPFPGAGHLRKAAQGFDFVPAQLDTI